MMMMLIIYRFIAASASDIGAAAAGIQLPQAGQRTAAGRNVLRGSSDAG